MNKAIIRMCIIILNDDHGINKTSWEVMREILYVNGQDEILRSVNACDDRYYLDSAIAEYLLTKI